MADSTGPIVSPTGALSYVDIAAHRKDKMDRKVSELINLAAQQNDIMKDLMMVQSAEDIREKVRYITSLPEAVWFHDGEGLESSKSGRAETFMLPGRLGTKIDIDDDTKVTAEKLGTWDEMLRDEFSAHTEILMQTLTAEIMYGDLATNADGFNGLTKYYNRAWSGSTYDPTDISFNVISAGGGDEKSLGSMFLVGHGKKGVYGFYPKTSRNNAGIAVSPLESFFYAPDPSRPAATTKGWQQTLQMQLGLAVTDWRKSGRICNFSRTMYTEVAGKDDATIKKAGRDLFTKINTLSSRVRKTDVRHVWYVDEVVWENLKNFSTAMTMENAVKEEDLNGHKVMSLNGIPVRLNECQLVDEALVNV